MASSARLTGTAPHKPKNPLPSCRVLLVEDNPDSRETLRAVLQAWGHTVQAVGDGTAGVATGLAWRPEAAVLDIGLPGLDGYQVARRLRAEFGCRLFLIALTGYSQESDRRRAFDAGFDVHMAKPADLDHLSRLLRSVAGGVVEY